MKRCSKCKKTKVLSEFFKSRRNKDGLYGCCKSCQIAYRQGEKGKAYQKAYQQSERGRASQRKSDAKFRTHNPNYHKAIYTVKYAIRAGRMPRANTRQCHYCPKPAQQYHHWHGYEPEHWLDVVPACMECHTKEHKKIV